MPTVAVTNSPIKLAAKGELYSGDGTLVVVMRTFPDEIVSRMSPIQISLLSTYDDLRVYYASRMRRVKIPERYRTGEPLPTSALGILLEIAKLRFRIRLRRRRMRNGTGRKPNCQVVCSAGPSH